MNGAIKLAMAGILRNGGADFLHSRFIDSVYSKNVVGL